MANTFLQIYIQVVFAVKGRESLLHEPLRTEVFKYISGIVTNKGHKSIIVGGHTDHVHILFGYNPTTALSDLVRDIKNNSTTFINKTSNLRGCFAWQEGYGGFSYHKSILDNVYDYILRQDAHHQKASFKEEFLKLLKNLEMGYNQQYMFEWVQ